MSTRNQIELESQKDPATLEREIDQQRAEISHIVEALESKLSPGEMIDRALGYARGNGGEFLTNLTDTLKANPVPAVLTGVGLAWLMLGQNHRPVEGVGRTRGVGDSLASARDRLGQASHEAGSRMAEARSQLSDGAHHAGERVSEATRRARQRLDDAGTRLGHGATRAREGFDHLRQEQPLALGVLGIAVGALIAATLPPTRREDQWLGETRDQLGEQLRHKAKEGYEQVSAKGEEMAGQLRRERGNGQSQHASGPH